MILRRYKICSDYIMTALWVGYCYKCSVDLKLGLLITKVQSKLHWQEEVISCECKE